MTHTVDNELTVLLFPAAPITQLKSVELKRTYAELGRSNCFTSLVECGVLDAQALECLKLRDSKPIF